MAFSTRNKAFTPRHNAGENHGIAIITKHKDNSTAAAPSGNRQTQRKLPLLGKAAKRIRKFQQETENRTFANRNDMAKMRKNLTEIVKNGVVEQAFYAAARYARRQTGSH